MGASWQTGAGAAAGALTLLAAGCAAAGSQDGGLTVYATTGHLADAVARIAPDAEVTTMVGPGGDPHTYQPSTRDVEAIWDADVVLWNGLDLEAQMEDQLRTLGDQQVAVAERLPDEVLLDWPETDGDGDALHDPHVWNSPEAWQLVVGHVADALGEADPANAEVYAANAEEYAAEVAEVAAEAERLLAAVPAGSRTLVTGHDAFGYFGEAFDLEVHATDFVSTEAALSPEELSGLADLVAQERVPAIFQDNQANPQAITSLEEAVASRGWQVEVSDAELYADSLGADPYLEVFLHNARTVADALGGEAP